MNWPSHGSNPQYLFEALNLPIPKEFIDFSANINPIGPPPILKEKWNEFYREITVYPDPHTTHLKEKLAEKENLSRDQILMGNGGAECITLIARMLERKRVLLVQPTFSEYEKACRVNKCEIEYLHADSDHWKVNIHKLGEVLSRMDALFLCSPNNPTGVAYNRLEIIGILDQCKQHNCLLIVDEAFYDFLEGYERITDLITDYSNLIILRSLTKMFAIPGIRLGYVVAQKELISKLQSYQPHWSVNTIAMLAGEACVKDETFIKRTVSYMGRERKRLFSFFEVENFQYSASKVNFYLLQDPTIEDQLPFFTFLLKHGMVPRHTFNFPGLDGRWLRFAIKSTEENRQLMEVLLEWRKQQS